MNVEQYDQIAVKLLKTAHEIEVSKRPAYTIGSADVFKNFKSIAERVGLTPQQVACVYWLKHVDAITAYLSDPTCPQAESIESRFADCINYLKLSYAMGLEKKDDTFKKMYGPMSEEWGKEQEFALVKFVSKKYEDGEVKVGQVYLADTVDTRIFALIEATFGDFASASVIVVPNFDAVRPNEDWYGERYDNVHMRYLDLLSDKYRLTQYDKDGFITKFEEAVDAKVEWKIPGAFWIEPKEPNNEVYAAEDLPGRLFRNGTWYHCVISVNGDEVDVVSLSSTRDVHPNDKSTMADSWYKSDEVEPSSEEYQTIVNRMMTNDEARKKIAAITIKP